MIRLKIAYSIAKALSYLHDRGIVHRKLSPKKVLLNEKYAAKLCGLSSITMVKFVTDCSELELYAQDIYSFGALLLEMCENSTSNDKVNNSIDAGSKWIHELAMRSTGDDIKTRPSAYSIARYLEYRVKLEEMKAMLMNNVCLLPPLKSMKITGKGTFCCTFLDYYNNKPVAVKHFVQGSVEDEIDLYYSAAIHASLQSPYIIKFIGFSPGEPMRLVEEYAEQNCLRYFLQNYGISDKLSWNSRANMAYQLAMGIAYLHSKRIAHRHLTPMNVLVDKAGNIKIGSMRLATLVDSAIDSDIRCEIGTVLWRAPELINHNVKDLFKADIYSLGLLLVELETFKQPFIETKLTPQAIANKVAARRLSPELTPTCPAWYRKLAYLCMCPLPTSRPTAQEIADVLKEHLNDHE
ncbi:kinase domain containing protein [Thraustotheca clavata]|uniref:Kinase domain containing protein n=1 Tax=Thraustotheca clavata TaxID=74557 RepID=A0A1V9ZQK1_9STRA|nr:kinase domain containing protein [Thraustotheca clavata]